MSNLSPFSTMTTVLQTSNIICQSVNMTDELRINLEYDVCRGLLNIFVKNSDGTKQLPCLINVLSNRSETYSTTSDIQPHSSKLIPNVDYLEVVYDKLEICYELSTTYVYDLIDSSPTMEISSFSSCSDEQMIDNDDGYSTHSHDDIEQQLPLAIPSSRLIRPSFSCYSEQYVFPVRRLIEQVTWLSPFRKTVQEMMMTHMFGCSSFRSDV